MSCITMICVKHKQKAAKPLHNRDIVSVHFNHFYCMGICGQTKQGLISVNLHISQRG